MEQNYTKEIKVAQDTKMALKKAVIKYGCFLNLMVSFGLTVVMAKSSANYGATLRGAQAYSLFQMIVISFEFAVRFLIPCVFIGYHVEKKKMLTKTVLSDTPESDYLWDYEAPQQSRQQPSEADEKLWKDICSGRYFSKQKASK